MPRKSRLLWTGPALADLESIREFVARDKPMAARNLAERLRSRALSLAELPESGRTVPELPGSDYREVIVSPYRIVYRISGKDILILRVWHSWRGDLPSET